MRIKQWILDHILICVLSAAVIALSLVALFIWYQRAQVPETAEVIVIDPTTETTTTTVTTTPEPTMTEAKPQGPINPLTGLSMDEQHPQRPLLVIYDNLEAARPQLGLIHADVGIEILAEGQITRLLGLFYSKYPEKAGPVRSARPYLAVKAAEFDAYFAHVGGSMQALADIVNYGIADFDGLNSGAFRREPPKEPPHNTYLSIETMLSEAERLGYRPQSEPQFLRFGEAGDGDKADYLGIRYRAATDYDPTGYYVEFYYDAASNLYKRYMNGEEHRDAASGELLTCSNVIVQIAGHHLLDREGRLAIDVIGGGSGHFFRDGKVYPITWRKNALKDPTKYYDAKGQEVLLAPGKTWIQVVPYDSYEYKAGNP